MLASSFWISRSASVKYDFTLLVEPRESLKVLEHEGTFCRDMSQRHVAATKSYDIHTLRGY